MFCSFTLKSYKILDHKAPILFRSEYSLICKNFEWTGFIWTQSILMNAEGKISLAKNSAYNLVIQMFKWCWSGISAYNAVVAFDNYCLVYLEQVVILHFKGKQAAYIWVNREWSLPKRSRLLFKPLNQESDHYVHISKIWDKLRKFKKRTRFFFFF